ncbi:hypothetical protein HUT18_20080 [Streptomyces sp. NA04227]|nr:hypothetical protein HUT18_20080 [Streptomyces sp. NA04227]
MSVLCEHDLALDALADVLRVAERRRGPAVASERRAWLYALARWSCLRALAEARRKRQGTHAAARHTSRAAHSSDDSSPGGADHSSQSADASAPLAGGPSPETESLRRRELALLAWPEAAGTTSEQREALELSVRHRLAPHEVAAVLGLDRIATRELLASAACEVERTRAALAVVERGTCPTVARLTGDHQLLLGTALRRELVRHVDDCPRCRRTAERAAPGVWPGTSVDPALPMVAAPRAELSVLGAYARPGSARAPRAHRARRASRFGEPRFDRRGFPMDPKDRAARRERLRARALTSTVVAAVIAAPVVALWAAYRGAPLTGEGSHGPSAAAAERGGPDETPAEYENAGNARSTDGSPFPGLGLAPDVSVEVVSSGASPSESESGPGRLSVDATSGNGLTEITLRASGGEPVHWTAAPSAPWLLLSRTSGTLEPGESVTIRVHVDRVREPTGHWRATVALAPSGALISVEGYGRWRPTPTRPTPPNTPPPHTGTPPDTPSPTRPPTEPTSPPPSGTTQPSTPPPSSPSPTPTASNTGPAEPTDSPSPTDGSPSR